MQLALRRPRAAKVIGWAGLILALAGWWIFTRWRNVIITALLEARAYKYNRVEGGPGAFPANQYGTRGGVLLQSKMDTRVCQ